MKRKGSGLGRAWGLLLGLALAGCGDYQKELEELCDIRGTCVCDAGSCCIVEGDFCDPGMCCEGLTCGADGRCVPVAQ